MSVMSGNDLNVKVDATTTGFERAIDRAQGAVNRYDSALLQLESDMMKLEKALDDEVTAALGRQHDAMDKTGRAVFTFGAALGAGLALAVNEAAKWESAWTGVTKTVDGSATEMERLETGLRSLATSLPATHEEIAAVAEAAGQLGIQREAILGFTKTMIDLSETTNLTAEDAATSIAQFANVMGTAPDQVDRLGASLVALGNAGASTEADILSMATRLAGAGSLVGATEADVLALANAMASMGIESQLGGGAMSRTLTKIHSAVKEGGDAVEGFAEIAGMSASEFATAFSTDPIRAVDAFVQGLNRIDESGGNAIAALDGVGIKGTQDLSVLLRLKGGQDLLSDSLDLGAQSWRDNTALVDEAAKRYETTEAKVAMARNALADAAITTGEVLLPALAALATTTSDVLSVWSDLPGPLKTGATLLLTLAAATALFGGAALIAVPKVAAFKATVTALEAGALKSAGTRLIGLGSFLMGPWGIALAAATAVLGIFAAQHGETKRKVEEVAATLEEQTGQITDNTRAWAAKELAESGAFESAKRLGISLEDLTDAALGNEDAIERVNDRLREVAPDAIGAGDGFMHFNVTLTQTEKDGHKVAEQMQNLGEHLDTAKGKSRDITAAMGEQSSATVDATTGAEGLGGAMRYVADETGEATEEIKTFGEVLDELSENYLNNREAGRAIRDSLRDIRKAVRDYKEEHDGLKGAFKSGTKSGDDFMGMLDDLAADYQTQVDTVERLTGSQEKTVAAHERARTKLLEVATQLFGNKKAAEDYVDAVLGTPEMIRTHFETDVDEAYASVLELRHLAMLTEGTYNMTFRYLTSGQKPAHSGTQIVEADGGIVEKRYGDGGMNAAGQYVPRVSQIVDGGANILWGEPETGWEAYISGKPGQRDRNEAIWLEAGRRLGLVENDAALRQMHVGGRSFGSGGFAGGGSIAEQLRHMQAAAGGSGGARSFEVRITNWRTGEGYMREIAADAAADRDALDETRGRMSR